MNAIITSAIESGINESYRTRSADDAHAVAAALRADPRCTDAVVVDDGDDTVDVDAWGYEDMDAETGEWRVHVACPRH